MRFPQATVGRPRPLTRHVRHALPLALASLCLSPAQGEEATGDTKLTEVVVTATRSSAPAELIPGTVTTIDRATMDRRQVKDIADLLADEPDVAVPRDMRRFGAGQINIRGIEDNRILMLVDGIRAADFRSPGSTNYDGANRDIPDPDFLKQVEIVRGPASSLYGSDAIGGVVGFLTLDPEDLLKNGKTQAVGGKIGYHQEDRSTRSSAYLAAGNEQVKGLLMVGHSDGHEMDNQGGRDVSGFTRTSPNPQSFHSTDVLAKLSLAPAPGHQLKLTLEAKDKETTTDIRRIANLSGTSLSKISRNLGDDTLERDRVSLDYSYLPADPHWFDRLSAKAFYQEQRSDNGNYQLRSNTTTSCSASSSGTRNCAVDQRFHFKQGQQGLSLVMEKAAQALASQYLTWGAEWQRTRTEEVKYTTRTDLASGVSQDNLLGENFPKSDFPKGHMDQVGLFLQDEFRFFGERLRVTPGVRYDQYRLTPESDSLYRPLFGKTAVSKDGSRVSAKLAAALQLTSAWSAYGQYVEGFRPPNYEQVNRYFYNTSQFYGVLGNPDLKPETSRGLEVGAKYVTPRSSAQVALFHNRYQDFIDYAKLAAGDPRALPSPFSSTYLYQNLSRVTIHGFELRGQWQASRHLAFNAAYAYAYGENQETGAPINSIDPRRLTAAVQWTPDGAHGGEMRLRAAGPTTRVDDSQVTKGFFHPGGYGVVDVNAWWQVQPNTRVQVGVTNLFDRKFWLWSDIRGASLPASDPAPDFYTQPGRNFSVTLKYDL